MARVRLPILLLISASVAVACAGNKPAAGGSGTRTAAKKTETGNKVLEGLVVERDREAPGTAGASYQGTGNYYLVFEVQEGQATARYRFQVSYRQWFRFPEGSHVRVTIRNNFLQDIKSID